MTDKVTDPYECIANYLSRGAGLISKRNTIGFDLLLPLALKNGDLSFVFIQTKCGKSYKRFPTPFEVIQSSPTFSFEDVRTMEVPYLYIYHHITSDPIDSTVMSFSDTQEEQEEEHVEEVIGSSSSGKKRKGSRPNFDELGEILHKRFPKKREEQISLAQKLYHFPCLAVKGVPSIKIKASRGVATDDCLQQFVKYFEEEQNVGWLNANSFLKNTWCQPAAAKTVETYDETKNYLLVPNSPVLGHLRLN
jgi:hypothetical protein